MFPMLYYSTVSAEKQGKHCIKHACKISMQSAEKSDYASYAQALFSVSQGKKQKKHAVSNENCVLFDFQMLLGKRKSVSIMRGEDSGVYRQ